MEHNISRRRWLGLAAGAAAVAPIVFMTKEAFAAQNAATRKALQYQDTPKDGKQCSLCALFQPGKDAKAKGKCTAIPGDDEISPTGWCAAFAAKPTK